MPSHRGHMFPDWSLLPLDGGPMPPGSGSMFIGRSPLPLGRGQMPPRSCPMFLGRSPLPLGRGPMPPGSGPIFLFRSPLVIIRIPDKTPLQPNSTPCSAHPICNALADSLGPCRQSSSEPRGTCTHAANSSPCLPLSRASRIVYATPVGKPSSPSLALYPTPFTATACAAAPAGPSA